jgi:PASTA domain
MDRHRWVWLTLPAAAATALLVASAAIEGGGDDAATDGATVSATPNHDRGSSAAPPLVPTTPRRPPAPRFSELPSVVGLDYREAATQLESLGLIANLYPVRSNRAHATVTGQAPAGGARVRRGSRMRLTVSRGVGVVAAAFTVPETIGLSELTAHARCRSLSFTCKTVLVPARRRRDVGRVVRQQPPAGTATQDLAQMTLFVGR